MTMIPSSCLGAFRRQQQQYAKDTLKSLCKKKLRLSTRGASTSTNRLNENGRFQSSSDMMAAAAATALVSLSIISSSCIDENISSIASNSRCQCDSISANPHQQLYQTNEDSSLSSTTSSTTSQTASSHSSGKLSSQPRNVMVHRLRSLRGRNLNEKYNVDWKTVLGEGAYGSVHPARLAATGEKVRVVWGL